MATLWPTTLPRPQRSGYGYEGDDPIIRTDLSGAAFQRVRRNEPVQFNVSWSMTDEQMDIFRTFWATIYQGARWFQVSLRTGYGILTHTARFTKVYKASLVGPHIWMVSGTLEVRKLQIIPKTDYETMLAMTPAEIREHLSGVAGLHTLVHQELSNDFAW